MGFSPRIRTSRISRVASATTGTPEVLYDHLRTPRQAGPVFHQVMFIPRFQYRKKPLQFTDRTDLTSSNGFASKLNKPF